MEKCHVIFGQNLKFWLQCCWDTVVEKPQQCTVLSSCSSHLSGQLNWANTGESTVKPSLLSAQPHYALGLHSVLQADFFFSVISAPLWFDKKNLEIWCEKSFINIKTTWQMKTEWDLLDFESREREFRFQRPKNTSILLHLTFDDKDCQCLQQRYCNTDSQGHCKKWSQERTKSSL